VRSFEELLRSWGGEQAVFRYDEPSGSWMFVCIHSTTLGPAGGGTRMLVYPTPADGLADAMRLSAAMTLKMAVVGAPFGGGKAVLAVPALPGGEERRKLLLRYGALVSSLGGTFRTAADVNTSTLDLDVLAEVCPYVYGRSEKQGGGGDSGRGTARGVYYGILASLRHVYGTDELRGRTVLVQGLGSVGGRLAAELAAGGADLLVSDVDAVRAQGVAASLGARVVAPESGARGRMRRLRALRGRGRPEQGFGLDSPLPDRRRRGEQPARSAGGCRTSSCCRHPLCPGLRHQRGRNPPAARARGPWLGRGGPGGAPRRDRSHRWRDLPPR
jgi:Glu/Leu/Phe/Val dehydrogenase, dimerisation domain